MPVALSRGPGREDEGAKGAAKVGIAESGREKTTRLALQILASVSIFSVLMIFLFIFRESIPAITSQRFTLMTTNWSPNVTDPAAGQYGMLAFLNGTIFTTLGGMVLGAPLGIGTAVFITRIAPAKLGGTISRGIELLAGIPSVIIGWFGLTLLVPQIARWTGTSGYGVMAASIVLAVMILPTVAALSAEALKSLPPELEEASMAMGATRWQTIRCTLLPAAKRGILVATVLGMGRAIGETMAVQMVVGNARQIAFSLTERTSTMTSRIITDMGESTGVFRSALYAQGLVLLLLAMMLILGVKLISRDKRVK
ncbi:MAG: phosphate ABC transporter permease subunit PstC [Actinobacteria bacterium]|nr:phosphate ABC transporter permease subunit PstC [Actinomycetota bacterium]